MIAQAETVNDELELDPPELDEVVGGLTKIGAGTQAVAGGSLADGRYMLTVLAAGN